MNYTQDIEPLEAAGFDDPTIAALLSSITAQPITIQAAKIYFRESGLWKQKPQRFEGKLHTAMLLATNPQSVRDLLEEMWAAIYGEAATTCGTTVLKKQDGTLHGLQQAHNVKGVVDFLVQTAQITAEDAAGFYALGGGMKHQPVDQNDVAAMRQQHTAQLAEQARQKEIEALHTEIENSYLFPAMSDTNATAASVRAAIKAGL